MGYGDELLAAGQAQRLYDRDHAPVLITGCDDRPRWHEIWAGNPAIVHPERVPSTPDHLVLRNGPGCRPYIVYPFTAQAGWTFNRAFRARDHRARVYLTDAERQAGLSLARVVGRYILIEPYSKHPNLRWPLASWQALVEACPDLTFVQHTHAHSPALSGVLTVPATFRAACGLVAASACYIRTESGMCHAAAALARRQVTIWGGCMDWDVLGGYEYQIGVGVDQAPPSPCGSWETCDHCRRIMAAISVEAVERAIRAQLTPW